MFSRSVFYQRPAVFLKQEVNRYPSFRVFILFFPVFSPLSLVLLISLG